MHWSEEIARKIIERNPNKPEYVCAAGISPSGSIHIGNFRDIATSLFVVQSLRKLGKKARLLFSWDEYDRLRKVPKNVMDLGEETAKEIEKYIGCCYVDTPNPFKDDSANYAVYFEKEFERAIQEFGIELDYRHQAEMYRSGKYTEHIITALKKRGEIFDILASFRTQEIAEGERENYYPVAIYCEKCHRDTTKIVSLSDDCLSAEYECKCGHKAHFDFNKDHDCKLAWKIDWPMRWMYEQVDFEPGGKDHASPNGSYQTSKVISEKIFNYPAPIFQGYEFIGIRGCTGKMSGSSGLNLTPATLLKIYQPEIILWLYSKSAPNKAFDFCFDEGILAQYREFDKQYSDYAAGTANDITREVIEHSLECSKKTVSTVPMNLLVQLGSVVNFRSDLVKILFEKIGYDFAQDVIDTRIELAKFWVEQCAPEMKNTINTFRNWDAYNSFNDEEKADIASLHKFLTDGKYDLDELQTELYAIIKRNFPAGTDFSVDPAKSEVRKKQATFFANAYKLLINKDAGPRLYLFLFAIDKARYLHLLDFSTPRREEEVAPQIVEVVEEEKAVEYGEPDPVQPLKAEITYDDFAKLDLRVCKIVKAAEIRKSHNCLKLTLNDGLGERVIVSSIKEYYKVEELIGKKIIVLANLESKRITGVTSEGMLLAAANNACGCKVIFVDDAVPEGTCIC